jgi:hypothetical protein
MDGLTLAAMLVFYGLRDRSQVRLGLRGCLWARLDLRSLMASSKQFGPLSLYAGGRHGE